MKRQSEKPMLSNKSTNVRSMYRRGPRWMRMGFAVGSRIAPWLTSSIAARLFLTTRRTLPRDREREALAGARAHRVAGMAAWVWGEGPTVLLVHGWNGRATQMGAFVAPLVSRGYRVVAFDAIGHGESHGSRLSLPGMADCVRRVAAELGDVHGILAHSMGAGATTIALEDGLDVERAVFVSPPSNPRSFFELFCTTIGVSNRVCARAQRKVETLAGRPMSELRADTIAPRMRTALLIVHDEDDKQVPIRSGQRIAEAWPDARFVRTEGLGHRRILESAYVAGLAASFIDERDGVRQTAA